MAPRAGPDRGLTINCRGTRKLGVPRQSRTGIRSHITQMWLDGVLLDKATSYSVTVNSFLASGGGSRRR